ncbi:hypothetical protein B9Z55_014042 [Caenorhabditis nigoni]|uniref:TatD related DNase n=1 Tax=Caenorhabditis nigoni TaxID=1611254 RepID=A0A2G5U4B2_9PELO|nr:hypothetical protein B9Z55_014042 [Caenorhabditis nigoni]
MSSDKGNGRELYQPPAKRTGSNPSTPVKEERRESFRKTIPNCCEEDDDGDDTKNSPVKHSINSEKSPSSSSRNWRSKSPSLSSTFSSTEPSSDIIQNVQEKCNIGHRRYKADKKPVTTRGPGFSKKETPSSSRNDDSENPNKALLEKFHCTDMPYIDSHCHTDFIYSMLMRSKQFKPTDGIREWVYRYPDAFPKAFAGMIANFIKPELFVHCADNEEYDFRWILEQIRSNYYLGTTWGCHPHNAEKWGKIDAFWNTMEEILSRGSDLKVLAVGECGIDLHRCESSLEIQKEVFDKHVALAYKYRLPLVIHCRNGNKGHAEEECLEILKKHMVQKHPFLKIHRHCYTENWEIARQWLKQCPDVHFGYTPAILTFKEPQIEAVRRIPLDRILLETDAPYFKPKCFDSITPPKVSLPGMAIATALRIAEIKNCTLEEVLRATYDNTRRCYQIPVY